MPTPLSARTALASAVTVALLGAPVAIGAPAFGSTAQTAPSQSASVQPAPRQPAVPTPAEPASTRTSAPAVTAQPDDDATEPGDAPSKLPAGPFAVRKAAAEDTFALFDGDSRFSPDDPGFEHSDIVITLPDIDGAARDFVLVPGSALDLVTDGGHEPYAPAAHGNGDRTFAFDVSENGTIGTVTETTPGPGEDGDEDGEAPAPTPQPTRPAPTPEPTPTGSPEPTPDPTRSPAPSPTDDSDDKGDDGSGSGSDESGDDPGADEGAGSGDLTDDPSSGNGSDDRGSASGPGPTGAQDWVPTAPGHPDYTDPVPQPPGADGDDSITPDTDGSVPQAGDEDGTDDIATDSAADEDSGAAVPWQIAVVVGIGAAAIGFILLVAGRRRAD